MSNTNTYLWYMFPTSPSKMDSTNLVQRAGKKIWPVHIGRIWRILLYNSLWGKSSCCQWYRRQIWFSKMPNSLAREMCWSSAGRIPQGTIAVRIFCIAARSRLDSSEDDSWMKLWSMDCQIRLARIDLRELYTPTVWFHWSTLFLPHLGYTYQASEFWTSIGGKAANHHYQTPF